MTNVIDKLVRNGRDYVISGNCSSGGGSADYSNLLFFGGGGLGDCVIRQNTQLKAGTYEFRNLTICEGVKLSFCGNGIPILKATGKIDNQGIIDLRNECGVNACCRCIAFLGVIQNHQHRFKLGPFCCCGGYGYRCGGGWGQEGGGWSNCYGSSCGGKACGCNGGGGAGFLGHMNCGYEYWELQRTFGHDATIEAGGAGGDGDDANYSYGCRGGGGGFGYRCGGAGGRGDANDAGGGGNSLYGKGGKGGYMDGWNEYSGSGGNGGDSYYGDGGDGGGGNINYYGEDPGRGGRSIWGNGGKGGTITGTAGHASTGNQGGAGGCSLYGNGGDGGEPTCGYCCDRWGREGQGGSVGGGQYGLMLVAPTICNHCIIGCGGNGGKNSNQASNRGSGYLLCGGAGGHGADVSIFYCDCFVQGDICNKPGKGGWGHAGYGPDGEGGCLTICNLVL